MPHARVDSNRLRTLSLKPMNLAVFGARRDANGHADCVRQLRLFEGGQSLLHPVRLAHIPLTNRMTVDPTNLCRV